MAVSLVSQEELPGPLKGYKLIERLGRGGFGEVWKVEAPGGLMKAAKFVFGDLDAMDEDSRPAEQELKALKRVREIRHPFILSLERYDAIDGQLIIVMELADRNLWDRYRECRSQGLMGVPREELLRYMEETAEALDLMNSEYQIQHLDVKPQNLFLVHNHVKVGDFGLVKILEGVRATVTGGVTPVYAAPETFEGWVSRFSDQYSLAIVFQELLTGVRPFNGTNTRQLLMQHIKSPPELQSLPPSDRSIIARALNKTPNDRWPTCTDMVRALRTSGLVLTPGPIPRSDCDTLSAQDSPTPVGEPAKWITRPGDDSRQATRIAPGGSGITAFNPNSPERLPPLVKPPGPPGLPGEAGTFTPVGGGLGLRLVTPAPAGTNPAMTLRPAAVMQTGRMGSLGIAPPEKSGDGFLFPALIIAVGQTGKRVMEHFKHLIADHYGHTQKVPNARFLYIDTDSTSTSTLPTDDPNNIAAREAVLARLNRPGHYLQRDSLPPPDAWMPPGMLYKLSRNPESAGGVRAFGRLALFDNYRLIAQRIRQEIETFLTHTSLTEADANTKLGLRTNRPRAYILTGLGGGTGSGMFIDLAYLLRHEMRQVGYFKPEVVGLLFAPPSEKASSRNTALGNTYAAINELHQFQARITRYQTTFDKSEAPVTDSDPPFSRVAILPLPKSGEAKAQAETYSLAARALYNEMFTQVGRVTDNLRENHSREFPPVGPLYQTFGLFRLSWPRQELLAAATRRFAQRHIQRWTSKDSTHLRKPITEWLDQQWMEHGLELETLTEELRSAFRDSLGDNPDRVADAIIEPLRIAVRPDTDAGCEVLEQLLKAFGKPDATIDTAEDSTLVQVKEKYQKLLQTYEGHVGVMAATFLELPQYRLPGAEEAVRQISARLKRQIDALVPIRTDLTNEVRSIYGKLLQAIGSLNTATSFGLVSRKTGVIDTIELYRTYSRKRLQLHILDMCLMIFRKLFANTPEYLREINFCRATLADMHSDLAKTAEGKSSANVFCGKPILPHGCDNIDQAADRFLADLAPEALLAFENELQSEIRRKLRGLGSICLKPTEKGPRFRALLLERAQKFLDERLDHSDPATAFFRLLPDESTTEPLVGQAFDESAPELRCIQTGEKVSELAVLCVPPGEGGKQFQELVGRVYPGVSFTIATLPDDICFYREYPQLSLMNLPQLGNLAREAYEHLALQDHPPHSRNDIPWQLPGR